MLSKFLYLLICFICVKANEYESWMYDNYNKIQNKTILDIVLPGTHDSGAYELTSTWAPGGFGNEDDNYYISLCERFHFNLPKLMKPWAICHSGSIYEQLTYGIRAFDIRAMWDGEWYIHHDFRGNYLTVVFEDVKRFLDIHPKEIVLLDVSHIHDYSQKGYNITELVTLIDSYLSSYLIPASTSLSITPISYYIQTNKRVICNLEYNDVTTVSKNYFSFNKNTEGVYSNKDTIQPMVEHNDKQIQQLGGHGIFFETSFTLTPRFTTIISSLIPCYYEHPNLLSLTQTTGDQVLHNWFIHNNHTHPGNVVFVDNFKNVNIAKEVVTFIQRECYDNYNYIQRTIEETDCRSRAEKGECTNSTKPGDFMFDNCKLTCGFC
ncbi:hypothetical protein WA158_003251 [Blastocystis sp. Blastoise]